MASLFKVKALYDFEAKEEDDLGFPGGQIIDVTEVVDDNWLEGKYTDSTGGTQEGIFPREFVEKYEPDVPARPTRPARAKQEGAPAPALAAEPEAQHEETPAALSQSKPQPPPVVVPVATSREPEAVRSPQSASTQQAPPPPARSDPPPAPVPTAAEPVSAKKPPPIAAKSNAFRDRIAAFNQGGATPVAPMVPGGKPQSNTFIKKPFVAPPPMSNSYVPPPKVETVHRPYIREEDPEIKRRQEEDHAAAESAGLTSDAPAEQQEDGEEVPKAQSLKERIARLQQQQLEQAQRRADGAAPRKEKKVPAKQPSGSSEQAGMVETGGDVEDLEHVRSPVNERQSLDMTQERPRVPSAQRPKEAPLSPVLTASEQEPISDGNEADQSAADELTEDDAGTIGPDDTDDRSTPPPPPRRASAAPQKQPDVGDEEDPEDGEDEEEDSVDEETRRRLELRERMAKMSGGMGMAGMFGPPGGMPMPGAAPARKKSTKERKTSEELDASSPVLQQRVPMVPMPGIQQVQSPEVHALSEREDPMTEEDDNPVPPPRRSIGEDRPSAPPVPKGKQHRDSPRCKKSNVRSSKLGHQNFSAGTAFKLIVDGQRHSSSYFNIVQFTDIDQTDSRPSIDRGLPPPVPSSALPTPRPVEPRPVPPPPPAAPMSPGPGSESDDESSLHRRVETPDAQTPGPLPIRTGTGMAPPVPGASSENRRMSYFSNEPSSTVSDKRASRPPPPVPTSPLTSSRPPPPPPPGVAPGRQSAEFADDINERGESEYEGDYDTDIASSAKHKEALKSHARELSLDDSTTADEVTPPRANVPRAVPPPPPSSQAPPPRSRQSMDTPRAPPPVPPGSQLEPVEGDEDYDPYRYDSRRAAPPPVPVVLPAAIPNAAPPVPPRDQDIGQESSADELYATTPPRRSVEQAPPPPPARAAPRESLDIRRSDTTGRRSMDARPVADNGQMAVDVPLSQDTPWWTASQPLPPSLQARNGVDILSECEQSTTSKRGGITYISKDIYILYIDYSQTIITARFDARQPADIHLEQRHLPPPPKLRQDQLESFWQVFGKKISDTANQMGNSRKDTIVGDGTPVGFVSELIKAQEKALQPVGSRSYGALVYANLANASTMQFDEIRPGDIITLRNARFEGTHGAMKHKYKQDYGMQHVAVVEEWDGTKRAIRGWEQGREGSGSKKGGVRSEKFRLGDLKSGEVRVWRVVSRAYVDWEQ